MMRLTAATFAVALLLASGCQPEPDAKAGGIDAAVDLIDKAALQAHLNYLASDELEGREAGEPGYDKAAAYVAEQFAAMGLEPAGDDGWYQQVPLVSYRTVDEGLAMTLHRGEEEVPLTYREEFAVSGDPLREETYRAFQCRRADIRVIPNFIDPAVFDRTRYECHAESLAPGGESRTLSATLRPSRVSCAR